MHVFERSTNKYTLQALFQTTKEGFINHVFDELGFILQEIKEEEYTFYIKVKEQEINIIFYQKDNKVFVQFTSEEEIHQEKAINFLQLLTSLLSKNQTMYQKIPFRKDPVKVFQMITWLICGIGVAYTLFSSFTIYREPYIFGFYVDFSFTQFLFGSLLTLTFSSIVYALSFFMKYLDDLA